MDVEQSKSPFLSLSFYRDMIRIKTQELRGQQTHKVQIQLQQSASPQHSFYTSLSLSLYPSNKHNESNRGSAYRVCDQVDAILHLIPKQHEHTRDNPRTFDPGCCHHCYYYCRTACTLLYLITTSTCNCRNDFFFLPHTRSLSLFLIGKRSINVPGMDGVRVTTSSESCFNSHISCLLQRLGGGKGTRRDVTRPSARRHSFFFIRVATIFVTCTATCVT